jgi:hypothetical protein
VGFGYVLSFGCASDSERVQHNYSTENRALSQELEFIKHKKINVSQDSRSISLVPGHFPRREIFPISVILPILLLETQ